MMEPLISRRRMLQRSAAGFGWLAAASMLAEESPAGEDSVPDARSGHRPQGGRDAARDAAGDARHPDPLAPKLPHLPARAKRVIFLFMKGGPSHVDTFDYKPRLQADDGKPLPFKKPRVQFAQTGDLLASPWKFHKHGESGIEVSELFPHTARCVDELCILNSVHGTNAAHGGALLKLHTGSDNFVRPSMGAWITYGLGTENQSLPGFITICPTLAHGGVKNWGAAFLPAPFQGTPLGVASRPSSAAKLKYGRNPHLTRRQQRLQLEFLQQLNRDHLERGGEPFSAAGKSHASHDVAGGRGKRLPTPSRSHDPVRGSLEGRIASFELAFRMQSELPVVQDISRESAATHRLYGIDEEATADFGRQCLMARRFAEAGVRFIQVTHSDNDVQWDQHGNLRKGHEKNAREVDKPIAGLLTDLKARGLLEDTLVMWGGEFGRTPTVQGSGRDGRDHNPYGFTMWLAGGGTRGGLRYGATDEYGYYAVENKIHIHDLHATLLHLLGLDHEKLTYRYAGRDFRLTDVHGHVVHEIMT